MIRSLIIAVLALFLVVNIEEHRLTSERSKAAATALNASNVEAERDSTRNIALENSRVARQLGDSLRLVEKQVLQVAQHRDALDKALGTERRARYSMSVAADSLRAVTAASSVIDTSRDVRWASFALRQPPYTVNADVEMADHPDSARLSLNVALDPIPLEARLTCSPPNEQGIRSASIVAAAPEWATVRFNRVEQSPDLCASPALIHPERSRRAPRLVIGAGRVMDLRGLSYWGAFVGVGMSLWGSS